MLLRDRGLGCRLDSDAAQASGLVLEHPPALLLSAGLDRRKRTGSGVHLRRDRGEVRDGEATLSNSRAKAVGEAALTARSPLDFEPRSLEPACRGVARSAGYLEAGTGKLRAMSEGCIRLGGGLAAVQRLIESLACLLEAGSRGAPLLVRETATQLGEALAHRAQLERRDGLLAELREAWSRVLEQVAQAPNHGVGTVEPV